MKERPHAQTLVNLSLNSKKRSEMHHWSVVPQTLQFRYRNYNALSGPKISQKMHKLLIPLQNISQVTEFEVLVHDLGS